MSLDPIAEKPESLTEIVYNAIREAIIERRLGPGDQLTESGLAQQLHVSKTPVREALLRLEYIGLIEGAGNRGLRVVTPSARAIRSAYEVRMALEAQAARLVAASSDDGLVRSLRAKAFTCLSSAEIHDRDGFRRGDRDFHLTLANSAGNQLLSRLIHDAFDLTWALRRRDVPQPADSLKCAKQHIGVVDAIASGDVDAADLAMREHVAKVQELVLAGFEASHLAEPSASVS